MKKSIFMLWTVVLFTVSAGIFIGCPNKPASKEEEEDDIILEAELFVIEFDKNAISCKKGNEVFYSGRGAEAETVLTFTAKLEAGVSVKEWLINGKNVVGQTEKTFKYTVKKTDAKEKNGKKVIKIQFVKNSPIDSRITIKFDKNLIKCEKHDSNGFLQTVSSGEKIAAGVELTFNAVLTVNETVEKWFVNGIAKENQTLPKFVYTVDTADATPQKEITISYSKKEIPKFFISFDKNKAECKKDSKAIMPDTEVKEGETLVFTALIGKDDAVDCWYIHDKKRPNSRFKNFTYKVKTSDAKEINGKQTIVISYEMKENIILKFNTSEIKCQIMGSFDWKDFTGTTIHKDDKLKFTANLSSGEKVSEWQINGNKKAGGAGVFEYTVAVADAVEDSDGKKVIEVKVIKQ